VDGGSGGFATRGDGEDTGDLAAYDTDARGVLELAGGLLETEVEGLLLEVAEACLKLSWGEFAGVLGLGSHEIWDRREVLRSQVMP